jgi:hypothetical protein
VLQRCSKYFFSASFFDQVQQFISEIAELILHAF